MDTFFVSATTVLRSRLADAGYEATPEGIRVLHEPDKNKSTDYDIVVVPGLGADPNRCWNGPKDKSDNEKKPFNWILDKEGLHEEFPNARILLFEDGSAWQGKLRVQTTFQDIAESLLASLNERRKTKLEIRPIVFMAHSMGGLVVAKALCLAADKPSLYPDIVTSVTSCICFGTPFYGAEFAKVSLAWNAVHRLEYDDKDFSELLGTLTPNNRKLLELTAGFQSIVERMDPPTTVFCFYEKKEKDWEEHIQEMHTQLNKEKVRPGPKGTTLVQKPSLPVPEDVIKQLGAFKKKGKFYFVTPESAILDSQKNNSCGMMRDHRDLVTFKSKDDQDYKKVIGRIRPFMSGAVSRFRIRKGAQAPDEDKVSLVKDLFKSGVNMHVELETLSKVSAKDEWLVKQSEFAEWQSLGSPVNCMWVEGPPGYGKTTASAVVAKFLARTIAEEKQRSSHKEQKTLWACFFCSEKPGCSTAEDLLKSILLQMIDQYSRLAMYAGTFLDQPLPSQDSTEETGLYQQSRATLTIEHLWRCLKDMLKDVSLHAVYIVVNNLHHLSQDESLGKLLEWVRLEFSSTVSFDNPTHSSQIGRWFLTTFSETRDDISRCLSPSGARLNVCKMNLQDKKYADKIKKALVTHVHTKAEGLRNTKGYNQSLAFEVEKIMESKAENQRWVDVACLQLETLPSNSSRLQIRDRLEAAARGSLKILVKESWEWVFAKMEDEVKFKVQDVLRALVLLKNQVTLRECSILTDYAPEDLECLIDKCRPMLTITSSTVNFANDDIRDFLLSNWDPLLVSPMSKPTSEEVSRQKELQHGYLAWRCFSFIDEIYASVSSSLDADTRNSAITTVGSGAVSPNHPQKKISLLQGEETKSSGLPSSLTSDVDGMYPIRHWRQHVVDGGQPVAQSLCAGLPHFWSTNAPLRTHWVRDYSKDTSEFDGLDSLESMSALHVASALGLQELSKILLREGGKVLVQSLDGNRYTPLHLAALNNHTDIVTLLLAAGADVIESPLTASPLHLAAVRGHVKVMRLLLASDKTTISDVNARSQKYGPVINAAIRSGVVSGVKILLERSDLSLNFEPGTVSPLMLAARDSEPEVFKDILLAGKKTWTQKHYEEALKTASEGGRIECVNAIIGAYQSLDHTCIGESLLLAGIGDHWDVATKLLHLEPHINYDNIFYLAATSKVQQDHLMKRIWSLASSNIPQSIRDAALYRATDYEKKTTVQWLLDECNADPNATADIPAELAEECVKKFPGTSYGDALTAAAHDGNMELLGMLLSSRALVDSPHGAALQTAARQGHLEAVDLLLDRGAQIDRIVAADVMQEIDMEWRSGTALQAACDYRQRHIVKRLLERKANPNCSYDKSVYTYPIISATTLNQPEILEHLLHDKRTNVKVCAANDGLSPLHIACERMDLASVERLLSKGADINAMDFQGNQAIHMAAFKGDTKIMAFLLQHNAIITHNSKDKGLALQEALRNNHTDCATLLANAAVQVFDSLTEAAKLGNGFAESIIKNPKAQHPRLDTKKIALLEGDIKSLQTRNKEVERTLEDYNAMKGRVSESQRIADEKVEDAEKARAELLDTHNKYDISIDGYASVRKERDDLLQKYQAMQKLEVEAAELRQQVRSKDQELKTQLDLTEVTTSELRECNSALQSAQELLDKERLHTQELQAEIDQLRNGSAPRGRLFSTASSDAFNQPGHETRQSSLSVSHRGTDQMETVSLADSDHHASAKERKGKMAKFSKISKDSFSNMSSGMAAGLGGFSDDVKAWQKRKKIGE